MGDERLFSPSTVAALLEKESNPARSSLTSVALRPKTRVSRVDSCSVFSRRSALCVAARAEGEGGRGAGFMACATTRGIVGILQEDTTGSRGRILKIK